MPRDFVVLYINGQKVTVDDDKIFMPLANFLRYEREKTGTKIVCAEGDCGACTVLYASPRKGDSPNDSLEYVSCNSCIVPVYLMDACSIITVEGVQINRGCLDPVQQSFIDCNASQCGFCTPGFIMSSVGLYEQQDNPSVQDVKNHLTGNLCRCTGYDSIIKAGCSVQTNQRRRLKERYFDLQMHEEILELLDQPVQIHIGNSQYDAPTTMESAIEILSSQGSRLIAGSTDLGVQINKGRHQEQKFLDLRLIESLYKCTAEEDRLIIGARVTLSNLRESLKESFPDYARFMNLFASPQIRNIGTLVGNIANASPIADATPYLLMSNALVGAIGPNGYREIPITQFYLDYKKLALQSNEMIQQIILPKPHINDCIRIYKISVRRDLDIACVNLAATVRIDDGIFVDCRLAYGGVGPVTIRATRAEAAIIGKPVDGFDVSQIVPILRGQITPISDVRGSRHFRFKTAENLLKKFFAEVQTQLLETV